MTLKFKNLVINIKFIKVSFFIAEIVIIVENEILFANGREEELRLACELVSDRDECCRTVTDTLSIAAEEVSRTKRVAIEGDAGRHPCLTPALLGGP